MIPLFRSTFLLYIALVLMQIIICFFVVFLLTQPDRPLDQEGSEYPYLAMLIVFLSGGAGWLLNKMRTDAIPKLRANFKGKLLHYRTTVIMRAAVVEAGNFFCIILALFERSLTPLLFFILGMLVFLYFRPRLDEITQLYPFTEEERQELARQLKKRT